MAIIALVVAGATPPSIATTALIGAIPLVLGALAMAVFGVETRRRSLEAITAEELNLSRAPAATQLPAGRHSDDAGG